MRFFSHHSQEHLTDDEVEAMRRYIRALVPVAQDEVPPSLVELFSRMSESDILTLRHFGSAQKPPRRTDS